jgi:hypothetical protein
VSSITPHPVRGQPFLPASALFRPFVRFDACRQQLLGGVFVQLKLPFAILLIIVGSLPGFGRVNADRDLSQNPLPDSELFEQLLMSHVLLERLLPRFCDALGEDVANELVDWFNAVDLTYKVDLRDLNELNFARFDAKLEQRLAELRAETRLELAALRVELIRWMFGFWVTTLLALGGTAVALRGH